MLLILPLVMLALAPSCLEAAQPSLYPKAIYGDDSRQEPYELPAKDRLRTYARSVAAIMPKTALRLSRDGQHHSVHAPTLGKKLNLCSGVAYASQPAPGYCTGFLVGPQLLATAGHCIKSSFDCAQLAIAFDYAKTARNDGVKELAASSVYRCHALVAHEVDRHSGIDYALIRLDRRVDDREPLKVDRHGSLRKGDPITMIGHPGGVALKVTTGGVIDDHSHPHYLRGAIDSFSGNSGSPIFNLRTGAVGGMLVRGEKSYARAEKRSCNIAVTCEDGHCRGEDILRPTSFGEHVPEIGPSLRWADVRIRELVGNGDGFADPGEKIAIAAVLHNNGTSGVGRTRLHLTDPSQTLEWQDNEVSVNAVPYDAEIAAPELIATISDQADCQTAIKLELTLRFGKKLRLLHKDLLLGQSDLVAFEGALGEEAIEDNTFPGAALAVDLAEAPAGRKVEFFVDVTHSQAQQLQIEVAAPDGARSTLFYRGRTPQGGFMQDLHGGIHGVYGDSLTPYQSIEAFRSVATAGRWTFHIADLSRGHTGVVNRLAIQLRQRRCH